MFEPFIITDHIIERYCERIGVKRKDVMKKIKSDLHYSKVKRVVNIGNHRHVFTWNSKEFIFKRDKHRWILKTIIKRTRASNIDAINQRLLAAK